MSKILPNTFMCFNVYVDRAMQHLTDSELRVLLFATRHILGWQDKIADRRGHISMTMFTNGFTSTNDEGVTSVYAGCGLGESAVRSACNSLCAFTLLVKVGYPSDKGQQWQLGETPDWESLEQRTADRETKRKQQVEKATQVAVSKREGVTLDDTPLTLNEGGTSNDTPPVTLNDTTPLTSDDTPGVTLNDTGGVTSNEVQQSHVQSHVQSHEQKEIAPNVLDGIPQEMPLDPEERGRIYDRAVTHIAEKMNGNGVHPPTPEELQTNIDLMLAKYGSKSS